MADELTSIVLYLAAMQGKPASFDHGRGNYAAMLTHLRRHNARLADEIHDTDGQKPITCSSLRGGPDAATLQRGEPANPITAHDYWVRFTGLTAPVSHALLDALLGPQHPTEWRLGPNQFEVVGAACDPTVHPWSGFSSYEALARAWLADSAQPLDTQVSLEFATPTAIRSKGMNIPFPYPEQIFDSLLRRWNTFSPQPLTPSVREIAAETVAVSRFTMQTQVAEHKNDSQRIGAVGEITYSILKEGYAWLRHFQLLADFALYSGVGVQTTSGMGQVRRRPNLR